MLNLLCDALVLGGGISGLSTAVTLQALGLKVAVVSETFPLKDRQEPLVSEVPTNYAMASAYPHFLRVNDLEAISDATQDVLAGLNSNTLSGVLKYRVFEVYEYEPDSAPLKERRMNFQEFDGKPGALKNTVEPPTRPGADYLWGWVFNSYFLDLPVYIPFLWNQFENLGGKCIKSKVTKELLEQLPDDIAVVNCLGVGAINLFDDDKKARIQRGCQILIKDASVVSNASGLPLSYNYYPTKEVFPRNESEAEYLHFFPRSDGWLFGQTREVGEFDENGIWQGEIVQGEQLDLGDCLIPKSILSLNAEILKNWCDVETDTSEMVPRIGYRYYRDPEVHGVRLEKEHIYGNKIVHNYAHGGSGITMSWGCALKAANLLLSSEETRDISKELESVNNYFSKLAAEI